MSKHSNKKRKAKESTTVIDRTELVVILSGDISSLILIAAEELFHLSFFFLSFFFIPLSLSAVVQEGEANGARHVSPNCLCLLSERRKTKGLGREKVSFDDKRGN